jgi:hypothetical protein
VGADKVCLFLKTVHHEERMDNLFELRDDNRAHGLTEDWFEVEWVCRQHDASRSTTERPESGGEEKAAQFEAKEGSVAESDPSGSGRDTEEGASSHMKDEAYGEAGRDRYIGTTGEGVEEATLSARGEGTAIDEAGEYGFRTPSMAIPERVGDRPQSNRVGKPSLIPSRAVPREPLE